MPAGFEAYDQNGIRTFSSNDSSPIKWLGSFTVPNSGANSGSFTDPKLTAYPNHVGFIARTDGEFPQVDRDAQITISGNTISWSWPNPSLKTIFKFMYGVVRQ